MYFAANLENCATASFTRLQPRCLNKQHRMCTNVKMHSSIGMKLVRDVNHRTLAVHSDEPESNELEEKDEIIQIRKSNILLEKVLAFAPVCDKCKRKSN